MSGPRIMALFVVFIAFRPAMKMMTARAAMDARIIIDSAEDKRVPDYRAKYKITARAAATAVLMKFTASFVMTSKPFTCLVRVPHL